MNQPAKAHQSGFHVRPADPCKELMNLGPHKAMIWVDLGSGENFQIREASTMRMPLHKIPHRY